MADPALTPSPFNPPQRPAFQELQPAPPPPSVTVTPPTKRRPGLKIVLAVLSLLLLLTAIPAGVFLVRQRQEVRELAASPFPTATPTLRPTPLPTLTPTPTPALLAQASPTPSPTATATATPSPTLIPTATPKASPTLTPTASPSALPQAGLPLPTAILAIGGLLAIIIALAL